MFRMRRVARRTARRTMRRVMRRTLFVGGMVLLTVGGAAAAIKISQQDAKRIEEHTGTPPDQLTDEELTQAMKELNIQSQALTPQDKATLAQQAGAQPSAPQPPVPQTQIPPATLATADQPSYAKELETLAGLRDKGIITAQEFEAKKKQLLGL